MKNLRRIKILLVFSFLFLVLIISFTSYSGAIESYRASVTLELDWSDKYPSTPIAPRDEIAEFELKITMNIVTGATFGAGILEAYSEEDLAVIRVSILEYPSWCSVILNNTVLMTNISEKEVIFDKLFIHVDEDAPAYEEGIIKINVTVGKLGLIKGYKKIFNLSFKPSYYPIIQIELENNTRRINPTSNAKFPIDIKNYGNAETKVFFDILEIPEGWTATVTDSVIVDKEEDSKAYLIVNPSRDFGYHDNDVIISIKITPTFADNINITGKPIFANFIIQNRGFSTFGIEIYLMLFLVIAIVLFTIIFFIKKRNH